MIIGTMSRKMKGILAVATIGVATALAAPPAAYAEQVFAGFVSPSGTVSGPSNFTAQHSGVGSYQIFAPQTSFTSGFPVMTLTPFGINGQYVIPILDAELCQNGTCIFSVQMISLGTGKPADNGFVFHVITD
jgi:hypothetical protein